MTEEPSPSPKSASREPVPPQGSAPPQSVAQAALPEAPADVARREQAERDIQRATDQSGLLSTGFLNRASDHFAARDVDQNDPVELLGRRIGRWLGLILFVGLAIYLWRAYLA